MRICSLVSTSGSTVSNFTVFSTLDGRIVNGIKANLGEFPHQVSDLNEILQVVLCIVCEFMLNLSRNMKFRYL